MTSDLGSVPVVRGDVEWALRQLRKQTDAAGLRGALRRHAAATSKSVRRRAKHHRHLARLRKQAAKAAARRAPDGEDGKWPVPAPGVLMRQAFP